MDHYQENSDTWNKLAGLYQEKFMDLDLYNASYDHFCDAIKVQQARILDIGCGPGNITKYLLAHRPDFQIEGTDIAPNMIELARQNNPEATFKVLDTRDIISLDNKYDGIVCGFCIPYLTEADTQKLITDTYTLLNPSGTFYLSFIEGDPENSGYQTGSSGDRVYFYYYQLNPLIQQLNDVGFGPPTIFRVDYVNRNEEKEMHTVLVVQS